MEEKTKFVHSFKLAWLSCVSYVLIMAFLTASITVKLTPNVTTSEKAVHYLVAFIGSFSGIIGTILGLVLILALLYLVGVLMHEKISFSELFRVYLISQVPNVLGHLIALILIIVSANPVEITQGLTGKILVLGGGLLAIALFAYLNWQEQKISLKLNLSLTLVLVLLSIIPRFF